jgi:hypothetical protein
LKLVRPLTEQEKVHKNIISHVGSSILREQGAIIGASAFGSFGAPKEKYYNQIQSELDRSQDFKHYARVLRHHFGQALLVPTAFGIGAPKEQRKPPIPNAVNKLTTLQSSPNPETNPCQIRK